MVAYRLFCFHRQQVPIEHAGRTQEALADALHRDDRRKSAGLPDSALDVFDALRKVRVAGLEVGPGRQDADDRLVLEILGRVTRLLDPAMLVRTDCPRPGKPALAAQLADCLAFGRHAHIPSLTHASGGRTWG